MNNCPTCGQVVPEEVLRFSGLELNLKTREVSRDGQKIRLSQREFAALAYMMRHPGRALTRTDICMEAWGVGFEGLTNCVDVYIRYLREKIDVGRRPLIKTVRGVGYTLAQNELPAIA